MLMPSFVLVPLKLVNTLLTFEGQGAHSLLYKIPGFVTMGKSLKGNVGLAESVSGVHTEPKVGFSSG